MDPKLEVLTIFQTRYRTYKYKVLPFRLTNGLATYQRYINDILFNYLNDFYTAYLDNIIIYSKNELEYDKYVYKVLQRLREAGLQANIKKLEFSVKRIKYLGFIISTDRIKTNLEKTAVITQQIPLRTVKGVQLFLEFYNFYRRFIKNYSRITRPLSRLTYKGRPFYFNTVYRQAFNKLKKRLVSAPLLAYFYPKRPLILETDTLDGVVAGVFF